MKCLVDVKVRNEMISWCEDKSWKMKVRTEMISWCVRTEMFNLNVRND